MVPAGAGRLPNESQLHDLKTVPPPPYMYDIECFRLKHVNIAHYLLTFLSLFFFLFNIKNIIPFDSNTIHYKSI